MLFGQRRQADILAQVVRAELARLGISPELAHDPSAKRFQAQPEPPQQPAASHGGGWWQMKKLEHGFASAFHARLLLGGHGKKHARSQAIAGDRREEKRIDME